MVAVLKKLLVDLISSKKAVTALVATLAAIVGRFGLHLDTDAVVVAIMPLLTYIAAQGIADHGKEAAKTRASAESPPPA